jgi:hypothetical protein
MEKLPARSIEDIERSWERLIADPEKIELLKSLPYEDKLAILNLLDDEDIYAEVQESLQEMREGKLTDITPL